jgi:hypothetical protein
LRRGTTSIQGRSRKYNSGSGSNTQAGIRHKQSSKSNVYANDHEETESYQVMSGAFGQTIVGDDDVIGDTSPIDK